MKRYVHTKTYTPIFIAASFITAKKKKKKQPKLPSTEEWIKTMWYNHMMEFYLFIEKNDGLIHSTTETILENIMLRERSQMQKGPYCMIPFI